MRPAGSPARRPVGREHTRPHSLSRGFDASAAGGLGRSGRCERAVLAGGRVAVRSLPGEGTLVELRLGAGPPA